MKLKLILIIISVMPSAVLACGPNDAPVFACSTTKGKFIEVCQTPTDVTYTFGTKGQKPEMALIVPTKKLDWSSDGGTGENDDSIAFHNGKTSYVIDVTSVFGKDFGDGEVIKPSTSATLEVRSVYKTLATLECMEEGLLDRLENLKATPRRN